MNMFLNATNITLVNVETFHTNVGKTIKNLKVTIWTLTFVTSNHKHIHMFPILLVFPIKTLISTFSMIFRFLY